MLQGSGAGQVTKNVVEKVIRVGGLQVKVGGTSNNHEILVAYLGVLGGKECGGRLQSISAAVTTKTGLPRKKTPRNN